jgi:hypothetical protein
MYPDGRANYFSMQIGDSVLSASLNVDLLKLSAVAS